MEKRIADLQDELARLKKALSACEDDKRDPNPNPNPNPNWKALSACEDDKKELAALRKDSSEWHLKP